MTAEQPACTGSQQVDPEMRDVCDDLECPRHAADQPSQPPLDEAAIRARQHYSRSYEEFARCAKDGQKWPCDYERERLAHEQTRRELSHLTINHRKQIDSTADAAVKNMRLKKRLRAAEATADEWRRRAEEAEAVLAEWGLPCDCPATATDQHNERTSRLSATWLYVQAFAEEMERKLDQNRHKGDREGWIKDPPLALLARLREEVEELYLAVASGASPDAVLSEAADVGNFAMMVADTVREWDTHTTNFATPPSQQGADSAGGQ